MTNSKLRQSKKRNGFGRQIEIGHAAYALATNPVRWRTKPSRINGLSKASGTTNGTLLLLDVGSMKNRSSSSLNRRRTRKLQLLFSPCRSRNRDGLRAVK